MSEQFYKAEVGYFGRWYIAHPTDESLAWSGSRWVPHINGISSFAHICNFTDLSMLREYTWAYEEKIKAETKLT